MTEEPYRWLEAVENRREYVREQLRTGSPAFGAKLPDGILLLAVGTGNSKVFELFDRHALTALGHPADIEKIVTTCREQFGKIDILVNNAGIEVSARLVDSM